LISRSPALRSRVRDDAWLLLAFALPAVAALISLAAVNDLAYVLRAGNIMLDRRAFLGADPFTFTMGGRDWLHQQWGAAVLFAALFRATGWPGIVFARATVVSLVVGSTYIRTRRSSGDPLVSGCLTLGAFVVASTIPGTFSVRPQLLALPLFVASAWLIADRANRPRRLLFLPLVGVAWANLHGSFVLLPLMLMIAFADDAVVHRRTRFVTGILTIVLVLTPMISPLGLGTYEYLWRLVSSPVVRDVVDEWRPITAQFPAWLAFLVACGALVAAIVRRRARLPTLEEGLSLAVFTGLAIWSGRNIVWWALAIPPIAGGLLAGWHPSESSTSRTATIVPAALSVLVVLAGLRVLTTQPREALLAEAPRGITRALQATAPAGSRVWDGRWGSWFELSVPSLPMFVDPRVELFPAPVWTDFFLIADAAPGWQDALDRWDVDVVVAAADRDAALIDAIGVDPGWRRAYRDGDGAIFVRAT
jgi:hypothetical protein